MDIKTDRDCWRERAQNAEKANLQLQEDKRKLKEQIESALKELCANEPGETALMDMDVDKAIEILKGK